MNRLDTSNANSGATVIAVRHIPRAEPQASPILVWAPFVMVAFESGLLVLLIRLLAIEGAAFGNLAVLMWAGFVVHHFLPARFRLPFFVALSLAGLIVYAGFLTGVCVIAIGLGLIGICHVPFSWPVRFGILAAAVGVLVACRQSLAAKTLPSGVWSVLAAMFMFRLIIYVYELYHRKVAGEAARTLAYFFMVPNVAFPLFPIVDYQAFVKSHYNAPALVIYQSGLRLILRGIVQLLIYRLVYHFGVIEAAAVSNLAEVAQFLAATSLLYLHVSGTFHIIVGLLHLFGFNLPATHHLYFLSSNFTDLWRRNNIYWRDFIAKIFFNPAYFYFKRLGATGALVAATLVAFAATWMLHSYQTFWLRGKFPLGWQDAVFWTAMAAFGLINTLSEARRGRQRQLVKTRRTFWSETSLALKTIGTYVTLWWILWTIWSRPTNEELTWLTRAALNFSAGQVALIVGGLAGLGLAAVLFGRVSRADLDGTASQKPGQPISIWPSALGVIVVSTIMLAAAGLSRKLPADSSAARVAEYLTSNRLNDLDLAIQRRGYYEDIEEANIGRGQAKPNTDGGQQGDIEKHRGPEKWVLLTNDFMHSKIKPLYRGSFKGKRFSTNRWGMRDRDYEQKKPAGAYRIALLGTSNEMGWGVADGDTFENLLEDRLNREDLGGQINKFEILNFSESAHGAFQKLLVLEDKGFTFEPDAVFWFTYTPEAERLVDHLAKTFRRRIAIPEPYQPPIEAVFQKAQISQALPNNQLLKRLEPYGMELVDFVFHRLADQCREHGVKLYIVYRPEPYESDQVPGLYRKRLMELARQCGASALDLTSCYQEIADRQKVMMDPRDSHANELGHRLLAEELYRQLHPGGGDLILHPAPATGLP
jgi:hypothetical protein